MPLNFEQQNQLYAEMARLKSMQPTQPIAYRTVFNDIADEWANCSEEEKNFIDKDKEYTMANLTYQQQFNAFLLELVGTQFINSQYGKSAESVLIALRNAKAKYKKDTADSVALVKAENEELQRQLKELKEMISNANR